MYCRQIVGYLFDSSTHAHSVQKQGLLCSCSAVGSHGVRLHALGNPKHSQWEYVLPDERGCLLLFLADVEEDTEAKSSSCPIPPRSTTKPSGVVGSYSLLRLLSMGNELLSPTDQLSAGLRSCFLCCRAVQNIVRSVFTIDIVDTSKVGSLL